MFFVTGNTVIDAMAYTVNNQPFFEEKLNHLPENRRIIAMTCHRRENYGQPMKQIFTAVREMALRFPDTLTVYPVHPSPDVREAAEALLKGLDNVWLLNPLDAMDMHKLLSRSYLVLTDSGGLQEEAPALGKPVLVLRRETERPEAVTAGTVKLAGVETDSILALTSELLSNPSAYEAMARAVNPYGDGQACRRIAEALLYSFGRGSVPPEPWTVNRIVNRKDGV